MDILDVTYGRFSRMNMPTLEELKNMLDDINPYVKLFRTAREIL